MTDETATANLIALDGESEGHGLDSEGYGLDGKLVLIPQADRLRLALQGRHRPRHEVQQLELPRGRQSRRILVTLTDTPNTE